MKNLYIYILLFIYLFITSNILCTTKINLNVKMYSGIEIGKIENGNGFMNLKYFDIAIKNKKFKSEFTLNTGFTSNRKSLLKYNHFINTFRNKTTYYITNNLGIFFSTSFSNKIQGRNNYVSFFTEDNYQSIGIDFIFM